MTGTMLCLGQLNLGPFRCEEMKEKTKSSQIKSYSGYLPIVVLNNQPPPAVHHTYGVLTDNLEVSKTFHFDSSNGNNI